MNDTDIQNFTYPTEDRTTGDWSRDNAIGRERAEALRAHILMTGDYPAFCRIVREISKTGSLNGIDVGFLHRVSEMMAR